MTDNAPQRYYMVQLKSGEEWLDVGRPFLDAYQAVMAARWTQSQGTGVYRVEMRTDAKCNNAEPCHDYRDFANVGVGNLQEPS